MGAWFVPDFGSRNQCKVAEEVAGPGTPVCVLARSARLPTPTGSVPRLQGCDSVISAELADSCELADVTSVLAHSAAERKVLAWMRLHQEAVISAEEHWCIDRRAIAGAIAWEALQNVRGHYGISRWAGVGKVHYRDRLQIGATLPNDVALKQVVDAGYLTAPASGDWGRFLNDAGRSIDVIGAIMRCEADIATILGGYPDALTYWNPPVLCNWYNTSTGNPESLRRTFAARRYPSALVPAERMGVWVKQNLSYLEECVGMLPADCRPKPRPIAGARPPALP